MIAALGMATINPFVLKKISKMYVFATPILSVWKMRLWKIEDYLSFCHGNDCGIAYFTAQNIGWGQKHHQRWFLA
jgi:hypothetical protein